MCGIVAVFGDRDHKLQAAFDTLLQVSVLRGSHSTGVASLSPHFVRVAKEACLPQDLMFTTDYDRVMKPHSVIGLLGHNRFATKGKINEDNAHPHQEGDITLVHNGTLISQWGLPDYLKYDSDSKNIVHAIATLGIEEAWPLINGPTALVYWDAKENELCVIRNDKRTLFIGRSKDESQMLIASEMAFISLAANRVEIELESPNKYPVANVLMRYRWDEKKKKVFSTAKELKAYTYKYNAKEWENDCDLYDWRPWVKKQDGHYHQNTDPKPSVITVEKAKAGQEVLQFSPRQGAFAPPPLIGTQKQAYAAKVEFSEIRKKNITEDEFKERFQVCSHCVGSLEHEYDTGIIISDYEAVCESCVHTALSQNMIEQIDKMRVN